ncbi:hypothetical protein VHEMI04722 [[Torrubiella] hemipterigena]|nr:hypothetical protein VHEMI04722 [[Torrubiella] hemipterigena]
MNIPGVWLTSPSPCASFRELYAKHDRVWFLPKYKIWFCDRDLMGRLIVVRYDPRRGCIEGYQLLAVSSGNSFEHWPADDKVVIHGFEPKINLHLDKAILQFHVQEEEANEAFKSRPGANRFADEMPMALDERMRGMYSNFQLTRPLASADADERLAGNYPYDRVWPPPAIPARHHVSGARSGQGLVSLNQDDKPRSRSQVSDQTFRIRQWMELAGSPVPPHYMRPQGLPGMPTVDSMLDNEAPVSVHIGEETVTYSTLDPVLYTPTPNKPWRGIWVGDYGGHGCEFLLINQPDDAPATDEELGLSRNDYETDKEWAERQQLGRIHRGRLEAIKLTGDPNIPRGEYTFVVEDLGANGCVGIATDAVFAGARVVKSKGHIAGTGFLRDKYIESQLILISPNKLAQYWVDFGHISFYERVDIDPLLKV